MKKSKIEIESSSEKLKNSPFKVPEGYFDELPARILSNISTDKNLEIPKVRRVRMLRYSIALAASLVGLVLISSIAIKIFKGSQSDPSDYLDVALLEEVNLIEDDSYFIEYFNLEEESLTDEDVWIENATEYLASGEIEYDLLLNEQ